MDSPELEGEEEEAAGGEHPDRGGEPRSMSNAFSVYEPYLQQMHPLIYYGDEFGYQQLSQIMAGKVDEHQHQALVASQSGPPVKQEDLNQAEMTTARVLHFGSATSDNPHPQQSICRLELDFDGPSNQHNLHQTTHLPNTESSTRDESPSTASPQHQATIIHPTNHPTPSNRELHNEIERRRRSRIKYCCEVLRTLVPGLSDKTDKATVLEQTVKFMNHLVNCPNFRCNCEIQIEERKQY